MGPKCLLASHHLHEFCKRNEGESKTINWVSQKLKGIRGLIGKVNETYSTFKKLIKKRKTFEKIYPR